MVRMNGICGTYSVSEFAVNESDGLYARHSFKPYPYDVVPKEAQKMIGKIDHILVKNLILKENTNVIVHDTVIPGTMINPSDHYPLNVELSVHTIN